MSSKRQVFAAVFKVAIPIAIIALLLYRIEPEQWTALAEHPKNYPLLVGALLMATAAISVSFVRWWMLVRCQGIEITVLEAYRLGAISFLLNFVAAGSVGGDLFKAIFLAKRRPGKRVQAVASVLVDRGVGLYGLLLLAAAAFLLQGSNGGPVDDDMQRLKLGTAVLVVLGTTVLAILVFGGRIVDRAVRWGSNLPVVGGLIDRIGPPLRMFHNHPVAFGISILMSLCVHTMLTLSIYMIAKSLYPSVPTLGEHFVIVPIGMLASALPLTPGGVGLLEAMIEWLYQLIPSEPTEASGTLVALVFDIVKILIGVMGAVFYWTAPVEVRESLQEAEESTHSDTTDDRDRVSAGAQLPEERHPGP